MSTADEAGTGEALSPRPSRALEIVAALVAVAFTVVFLVAATQIPLRSAEAATAMTARTWPTVLGVAGVAVSVLLLVVAITRPAPARDDLDAVSKGGPLRVVLTLIVSIAFVAAWSVQSVVMLGYRIQLFPVIAAVYLAALLWLFGHRKWLGFVLYPIGLTAFIYVLFGMVLRIPL